MEPTIIQYDSEKEVGKILQSLISENEILVECPIIQGCRYIPDFILPNGLKSMALPGNTIVEVKFRLNEVIGSQICRMFHDAFIQNKVSFLLIVCVENSLTPKSFEEKFNGKFKVISLSDLKKEQTNKNIFDNKNIRDNRQLADVKQMATLDFKLHKVTLFLGAGLSMDANLPSWNKLLETLLEKENNKPFKYINKENSEAISDSLANSAIVTGRYVIEGYKKSIKEEDSESKYDSKTIDELTYIEVSDRISEILYKNCKDKSLLVKAVAKLVKMNNVTQVISYNYDDLLEYQLKKYNKICSKYNDISFANEKPIYHVHGYIPRNKKDRNGIPVLSEREYHCLYSQMHHWANVIQLNALYTTSCFFIGFSMTDPNQRRLLDLARNRDTGSNGFDKVHHYVFLKRQALRGEAIPKVNDEHCQQIEKMMYDLGLNVIWYDRHSDLPGILLEIASNSKQIKI